VLLLQGPQSDSPESSSGFFLGLLFLLQHRLLWTSSCLETLNHDPEDEEEEGGKTERREVSRKGKGTVSPDL